MPSKTGKAVRTSLVSLLWTWLAIVLPVPLFLWSGYISASSAQLHQRLASQVRFIRDADDLVEATLLLERGVREVEMVGQTVIGPAALTATDLDQLESRVATRIADLSALRDKPISADDAKVAQERFDAMLAMARAWASNEDPDERASLRRDLQVATVDFSSGIFSWIAEAEQEVASFEEQLREQLGAQARVVMVASVMALLVVILMYSYRLSVRAQRRAEAERDRFFDASLDMQFIADFDGRFRQLNRAWQRTLGRPIKELVGTAYISLVHPDDRAATLEETQRIRIGGDMVSFENRCETGTGEYRWFLWTATPDIERRLMYGTVRDITERKQAQIDLKETADRLERSNRELEDFASVASHDLQEPLRKVMTFGERIAARAGKTLDEQSRDYLDRMRSAAVRMKTLIVGLLTLSRVTTRGNPFERINLTQVVREVLSDLEVRIEQSGAQVELETLPTIEADPLQMRQLFQNLIGNALKFHRPGQPPRVRIYAAESEAEPLGGTRVRVIVQDEGIGFDPKYIDRIFGVFQRLHGRDAYEGTGVGLAVCRKIVERHLGTIEADSSVGGGARFTVTLPATTTGGSITRTVTETATALQINPERE